MLLTVFFSLVIRLTDYLFLVGDNIIEGNGLKLGFTVFSFKINLSNMDTLKVLILTKVRVTTK